MRKAIHIAAILILLVCLEVVWGEETKEEGTETSGEGSGANGDEGEPAPPKKNEAAEGSPQPSGQEAAPGATDSPKKLGRMANSIVPAVIAAIGAALL